MTNIHVNKLTLIGSDIGLSPDRRQAIIWTNAGILLIGPWGTNVSGILIECHTFSFKKMHLKMSSGKWRPQCVNPSQHHLQVLSDLLFPLASRLYQIYPTEGPKMLPQQEQLSQKTNGPHRCRKSHGKSHDRSRSGKCRRDLEPTSPARSRPSGQR